MSFTSTEIETMITTIWRLNEKVDRLTAENSRLTEQVETLRRALQAIREAPGGGPGRRIATQALDK